MLKKFKKNISIAMTAALIVAQLPVMTSFAADAVAIDENFNSLNAGNFPDGWTATSTGTNSVGAVEVESGNKAIDLNADTPGTEVSLKSPTFNYDKFTVTYKVKFDNASGELFYY